MTRYVIKNLDSGQYMTPPGVARSYTKLLQHARTFTDRKAAERECCLGNEIVTELELELIR